MADKFLYEELDAVSKMGFSKKEIPDYLKDNLNPKFELRPYQVEAFSRFFTVWIMIFPVRIGLCTFSSIWPPAVEKH